MEEVYVLDATALILGCIPPGRRLIPSAVASEIGSRHKQRIEAGDIEISSPSGRQMERALRTAESTGDLPVLSQADLEVLAVALDEREAGREPIIVSDDYAVQNVAAELGIKAVPVGQEGIKRRLRWKWYCASCRLVLDGVEEGKPCPRCGAEERRRRREKK